MLQAVCYEDNFKVQLAGIVYPRPRARWRFTNKN